MLAADQVWAEIRLSDPVELGWRCAASALAHDTYAMVTRHSWLMSTMSTHFVYGPGMARHQDYCYAVFKLAGFTGTDLDWAVNAILMFVAGTALGDATWLSLRAQIRRTGGNEEQRLKDIGIWAKNIAQQFPRLRARIEEQGDADPRMMGKQSFEFGVETILDGLESRLRGK